MFDELNEILVIKFPNEDFLASNVNSPKGGWGYLIVICAVLVNVINQGLLLSTSLMAAIADRSFHIRGPQFGVYTGGRTNFVVILVFVCF